MVLPFTGVSALPPPRVSSVTPLKADRFARELQNHPDQTKVAYVLAGIRDGFRLGFNDVPLKPAKRNKKSAEEHPAVVE